MRDEQEDATVRLTIPRRLMVVPATAFVVGCAIGMVRGGRRASLRFLAENAHRPPTTVQGWYFYKKTKNYKVMWGALKGAGTEAVKVTSLAGGYVVLEEGMERVGWGKGKHTGAAVGMAVIFSVVYRLRMNIAGRAILLGAIVGVGMDSIRIAGVLERPQ